MNSTKRNLKRQFETLESMAIHLRETVDEASRQLDDGQTVNAFMLMRAIWPAVIYCFHRRYTGTAKPRVRSSTALISGLTTNGLSASLIATVREADIVAVMDGSTPDNALLLITAATAALDATETATGRRSMPAAIATNRRRPAILRWASAAAGLYAAGH